MSGRSRDTAKVEKAPHRTPGTAAHGGPMEEAPAVSGGQVTLDGVAWQNYLRVLRAFGARHLRITYDRGAVELMTLSPEHERVKPVLHYLLSGVLAGLGG